MPKHYSLWFIHWFYYYKYCFSFFYINKFKNKKNVMLAHIQRDREMIQIAKYIYTDRETRMSRLLKTKHIQQTRSGMNKINHDKEWRWRRNALTLSVPTTVSFTLIRFILIEMIAILSLSVCLFLSLAVAVHVKHMCMLAIFFFKKSATVVAAMTVTMYYARNIILRYRLCLF